MPDAISPVAAMIQPPNPGAGLSMLSSLLQVKQQEQNLQTGQYDQATAQAKSQQAQQQNSELQALAQFTHGASKDPAYLNADGTPNVQKYQRDAMAVAPVYGEAYIGQMTSNFNAGVQNRQALLDLSADQQQKAGGYFADLATKPNATGEDLIEAAEQARGLSDDPNYQRSIDRMLLHAPQTAMLPSDKASAAMQQYARHVAMAVNAPQIAAQQPNYAAFRTGTSTNLYQTNPFAANAQQPPQALPAPAEVSSLPSGQLAVVSPAAGTARVLTTPGAPQNSAPTGAGGGLGTPTGANQPGPQPLGRTNGRVRTAQDDAPGPNAPAAAQQNFLHAAQQARDLVAQTRTADDSYGSNMSIADNVRRLASSTNTGPGSAEWNQFFGAIGSRFGANNIANYQTLGSFLDRQAAGLRSQMGLPATNEGVATSQLIGGNTEYQRNAILAKNDYNEALTQGLHDFRQGLDRVEGFSGNPSPRAVQQYRSAWASNFDPTFMEYKLAKERGDEATARKIVASLSPSQAQAMLQKGRNLDALKQGSMPQ